MDRVLRDIHFRRGETVFDEVSRDETAAENLGEEDQEDGSGMESGSA